MSSWAGNLIRIARLDSGLSQRQLARRAGTSQAAIAAYETGKRSPSLETLARIVRAAGRDLRIQLAAADAHDEWLARYERSLPADVVEATREMERELIAATRSEQGRSAPASLHDIVAAKRAAGREKDAAHLAILLQHLRAESTDD